MCVRQPSQPEVRCVITYKDKQLEQVTSYRYLGVLFDNTGNVMTGKNDIYKRGLKVFFKLLRDLHPLPKVSTSLHLFDKLIKPILIYGVEILSPFNLTRRLPGVTGDPRKDFFVSLKRDFPVVAKLVEKDDPGEKLHLKFCKRILGVHQKTTNVAIYGELGRYPLFIDEVTQCLKYEDYLLTQTNNPLLKEFYTNLINQEPGHKKGSLLKFCSDIQDELNISQAPRSLSSVSKVKRQLRERYHGYWSRLMHCPFARSGTSGGNKMRTYALIKRTISLESYLHLADPESRKRITRLRVSAHRLCIETMPFNGKNAYVPVDDRLCVNCQDGVTEDKFHFLIKCRKYDVVRQSLFDHVSLANPFFAAYSDTEKFMWIMTTEHLECAKKLSDFIAKANAMRTNI